MSQGNSYKPRYSITYTAKSKIWPYKDSYLRRFYALRARRVQRGGLFRNYVLVAITMKWTQARRFIRPLSRSAGSTSISTAGKTAFGRPLKRRYRDRFYRKQQLRFFYGKIKETAFRQMFRAHLSTIGSRTHSFVAALESRLDRVLFRRRLLPTVFACHQFIHHQGLEINGALEKSPRASVQLGDIVAVPSFAWKAIYWDLFCRVYYRRWGLYILRRRYYTQIKKHLYFRRSRRRLKQDPSFLFYKNYLQIKKQAKSQHQSQQLSAFKGTLARFHQIANPFLLAATPLKAVTQSRRAKTAFSGLISSPNTKIAYTAQIKELLREIGAFEMLEKTNSQVGLTPIFRGLSRTQHTTGFFTKKDRVSSFETKEFVKRLYAFRSMSIELVTHAEKNGSFSNSTLVFRKLQQFQKLYFALRLRKSLRPQVTRFSKLIAKNTQQQVFSSTVYRRPYRRSRLLRFYLKRRKKQVRFQKIPRIKGVHFYTPSYLQMDFRTLRAVKVKSPTFEDVQYPFRVSLAKRYSFYRSKGF